jgi:hypothetical protein
VEWQNLTARTCGRLIQNSGLPDNSVEEIEIDDLGNKWIKTQFGGLAVFREGGVLSSAGGKPVSRNDMSFSGKNIIQCAFSRGLLRLFLQKTCNLEISIYNLSGKCAYRISAKRYAAGDCSIQLRGQRYLPNGTYLVDLKSGTGDIRKRLCILQ